jgi:hypothetical protein
LELSEIMLRVSMAAALTAYVVCSQLIFCQLLEHKGCVAESCYCCR